MTMTAIMTTMLSSGADNDDFFGFTQFQAKHENPTGNETTTQAKQAGQAEQSSAGPGPARRRTLTQEREEEEEGRRFAGTLREEEGKGAEQGTEPVQR